MSLYDNLLYEFWNVRVQTTEWTKKIITWKHFSWKMLTVVLMEETKPVVTEKQEFGNTNIKVTWWPSSLQGCWCQDLYQKLVTRMWLHEHNGVFMRASSNKEHCSYTNWMFEFRNMIVLITNLTNPRVSEAMNKSIVLWILTSSSNTQLSI